jgi:hypothetical protein
MQRFVALAATVGVFSLLAFGQETLQSQSVKCAAALEMPAYPRLARIASISGSVAAHLAIGSSGKVEDVRLEGHSILAKEVDSAISRTKFPAECRSQRLDLTFEFRLEGVPSDEAKTTAVFNSPNRYIVTSNATGIICILRTETKKATRPRQNQMSSATPRFSDIPASSQYHGPIAAPLVKRKSDEQQRALIERAVKQGPNFAGHYVLAKFQMGDGPIGAVVVDAKSGSVFHLPSQVVREDFFIYDTDCLALYRRWHSSAAEEDDDASVLSFLPGSEMLIVRRCTTSGVEKTYFRWHGNQWSLLHRAAVPPPPPLPVQ